MRSVAVVVALVACLHAGAWAVRQTQATAPNFEGILNSVSYSPFTTSAHPDHEGSPPPEERIRADLKAIAPYTRAFRPDSSTGGVEQVPKIRAEFGINVTLGIWLDKSEKRGEKEPRAVEKSEKRGEKEPRAEFDPECKTRFKQDLIGVLNVPCNSRNIREITSAL